MSRKYWVNNNAEHIYIDKMETSHIINCIGLLERNVANALRALEVGDNLRGKKQKHTREDLMPQVYYDLAEELSKRNEKGEKFFQPPTRGMEIM